MKHRFRSKVDERVITSKEDGIAYGLCAKALLRDKLSRTKTARNLKKRRKETPLTMRVSY